MNENARKDTLEALRRSADGLPPAASPESDFAFAAGVAAITAGLALSLATGLPPALALLSLF